MHSRRRAVIADAGAGRCDCRPSWPTQQSTSRKRRRTRPTPPCTQPPSRATGTLADGSCHALAPDWQRLPIVEQHRRAVWRAWRQSSGRERTGKRGHAPPEPHSRSREHDEERTHHSPGAGRHRRYHCGARRGRARRFGKCERLVPAARDDGQGGVLPGLVHPLHRADRRHRAVLDGACDARKDRPQAPPSTEPMRSRRCACCRWCSAGCCGRSPGSGPTSSRSRYRLAYGTDKHEDYFSRWARRRWPASCRSMSWTTCATSSMGWPPRAR